MVGRAEVLRERVLEALRSQPLFDGLGESAYRALADQIEWFALEGGRVLFDQDEASDGMYLLIHGRLSASRREADGRIRHLGTIAQGETVGETGLLANEPRNARVIAMRDCNLLFLPRSGFEKLAALHPEAMLRTAQLALRRSYSLRKAKTRFTCFALISATPGVDMMALAQRLAAQLDVGDQTEIIDANKALEKPIAWFSEREAAAQYLIYVADTNADWRERCVRQSDCVLLVADSRHPVQLQTRLPAPARGPSVPVHLLMLNPQPAAPGSTGDWLERLPQGRAHHHIRSDEDLGRVVRHLTGSATGLVLSGGGARGFAHLGVIRALREAGWKFDYVGGTSIGAILGAGLAAGWDDATMRDQFRQHFVTRNPLADWTLPLVSLRSGKGVVDGLRAAFNELEIEDLPIPFFCVSSNLTEGDLEVHDSGLVWQALRASSAIPGVLPPLFHAGRVLVDGGVIDNLPVSEMRKRLDGEIVASDVGGQYRLNAEIDEAHLPPWWQLLPELFGQRRRPGIGQILLRAGMVNVAATAQRARKQTKLLLTPPLEGIDLLDWKAFDRAEAAGYAYACEQLEAAAAG
ncbi:patatin-like phospholipase family protein [Pseudomarimonas arenosa]|uniref:Patatin-like phospholipase family protein n=1 Tax=Pseudomarimonas arenosa TaxID=2774145 RepID=A0AAW3ZRA5_9GAMM|nr:patatin-like phospholipase family protein [Pseudomarimonas arenosa]MBD8527637.1 patatin-like phospholipase family protein [Pseudomarimonas arenosa]